MECLEQELEQLMESEFPDALPHHHGATVRGEGHVLEPPQKRLHGPHLFLCKTKAAIVYIEYLVDAGRTVSCHSKIYESSLLYKSCFCLLWGV